MKREKFIVVDVQFVVDERGLVQYEYKSRPAGRIVMVTSSGPHVHLDFSYALKTPKKKPLFAPKRPASKAERRRRREAEEAQSDGMVF